MTRVAERPFLEARKLIQVTSLALSKIMRLATAVIWRTLLRNADVHSLAKFRANTKEAPKPLEEWPCT